MDDNDIKWMKIALEQAKLAAQQGEVPVGAVLVKDNYLIAQGHNQPISQHDPTAHAEMVVLRAGGIKLNNYRLINTTLYVTLEPCLMCLGAILHARVRRLVFAATDPRAGAVKSNFQLDDLNVLKHKLTITAGVLAHDCSAVLIDFFKQRR